MQIPCLQRVPSVSTAVGSPSKDVSTHPQSTTQQPHTHLSFAVFAIILYGATTFANASLTVLLPFVRRDEQMGWGEGDDPFGDGAKAVLAWSIAGRMLGKLTLGPLIDAIGPSHAIALCLGGSGLLLAAMGLAGSTHSLGAMEFARQIISSGMFPATLRLLGGLFLVKQPDAVRTRYYGLLGLASRGGSLAGTLVIGLLARGTLGAYVAGWRTICVLVAALPLLLGVGWSTIYMRAAHRLEKQAERQESADAALPASPRSGSRFVRLNPLATTLRVAQKAFAHPIFCRAAILNACCKMAMHCGVLLPLALTEAMGVSAHRASLYALAFPLGQTLATALLPYMDLGARGSVHLCRCCALMLALSALAVRVPSLSDLFTAVQCVLAAAVVLPYYVEITSSFVIRFGRKVTPRKVATMCTLLDSVGFAGNLVLALLWARLVRVGGWHSAYGLMAVCWCGGCFLAPSVFAWEREGGAANGGEEEGCGDNV